MKIKHKTFKISTNVDWRVLRVQKHTLLDVSEWILRRGDTDTYDNLYGIVEFIDHVQDSAAEQLPNGEELVFGKDKK